MNIGQMIQDGRKEAGLTQKELADMLNVSRGLIARIECGDAEPSLRMLERIGIALDSSYTIGKGGKA